jgi:hypothetical protein
MVEGITHPKDTETPGWGNFTQIIWWMIGGFG